MATFSQATFNAASYAAYRPTYPPRLFNAILNYHRSGRTDIQKKPTLIPKRLAAGQATNALPRHFDRVIGADPSKGMIEQARAEKQDNRLEFIVSAAEDIASHIPEGSVDLVTAGQAAHWFDYSRIWPALAKILKPGGTGYAEHRIVGHPELTPLVNAYSKGANALGPFWEQPGRDILDNHFRDVRFPTSSEWNTNSGRRVYFAGDHAPELDVPYHALAPESETVEDGDGNFPEEPEYKTDAILTKRLTWDNLQSYLRTWSSLHSYQQRHPEDKERTGR
ncbi:hypothetical protein FRB99_001619, partial [Tulasnella sp. 403]